MIEIKNSFIDTVMAQIAAGVKRIKLSKQDYDDDDDDEDVEYEE